MYSGINFLPFFINCEEHSDTEEFQRGIMKKSVRKWMCEV